MPRLYSSIWSSGANTGTLKLALARVTSVCMVVSVSFGFKRSLRGVKVGNEDAEHVVGFVMVIVFSACVHAVDHLFLCHALGGWAMFLLCVCKNHNG